MNKEGKRSKSSSLEKNAEKNKQEKKVTLKNRIKKLGEQFMSAFSKENENN